MLVGYDSEKTEPASQFFYQLTTTSGKDVGIYQFIQDRLPLDPHIRAVVVKGRRKVIPSSHKDLVSSVIENGEVLLETTKLDFDKLREVIKESKIEAYIPAGGKSAEHGGSKILQTTTRNAFPKKPSEQKDMRTLISIIPEYGKGGWEQSMQVLDLIDGKNCYSMPRENTAYGEDVAKINEIRGMKMELTQEMKMEMQRLITQMQVPKLALELNMTPYLEAKMYFNARILRMSRRELGNFVENLAAD